MKCGNCSGTGTAVYATTDEFGFVGRRCHLCAGTGRAMNKMELLRADAEPGRCAVCSEALKGKRTVLCGARECADVYALTAQMVTTEKRLKACCERAGLARARRGK